MDLVTVSFPTRKVGKEDIDQITGLWLCLDHFSGLGEHDLVKICLSKCCCLHDTGIDQTGNGGTKKDRYSSSKASIGRFIYANRDIMAVLRNLVSLSHKTWMRMRTG